MTDRSSGATPPDYGIDHAAERRARRAIALTLAIGMVIGLILLVGAIMLDSVANLENGRPDAPQGPSEADPTTGHTSTEETAMTDPATTPNAGSNTPANVATEITFTAANAYADPFNDVTLDVVFTDPEGTSRRVPAFWAGGDQWKVRYASPLPGEHAWRSDCSASDDAGLHGRAGVVEVVPYEGSNALYHHGPLRVAADRRHLEHADGAPFFWLGDTWWMGLCNRITFPSEFGELTADRVEKGFTVVQIVAGLYPDMHPFDERGANEAGFPWEEGYARIRPAYFDAADARLAYLIDHGLTPCIVGAWGYFLPWMGEERMQQHWRYLIARYGAWPVVWCTAGEANLPWYLADHFPSDDREQAAGWTELVRYVRETDPFRRPLTIHPTAINRYTARHACTEPALLDFDMLQTPHGQREAVPITVQAARDSYAAEPRMPLINGEAAYEMLLDQIPAEWTRAMFWVCMMNGAKGHTYGANGIWQCNRPGQPHGPSPHNDSGPGYGTTPWNEAMHFPGSSQMGYGKRFFETLPWVELEPMIDSVTWAEAPPADEDPLLGPQACGIGTSLRTAYMLFERPISVHGLAPGATYGIRMFDPVTGVFDAAPDAAADVQGALIVQPPSRGHDWVVVIEAR